MPTKAARTAANTPETVEAFLARLDHPLKQEILALRQIIRAADPSIVESVKWNAPSFATQEHFATMQLRATHGVQIILHLGAKKRATAQTGITIADPESLLVWLAPDRASVTFQDMNAIATNQAAFVAIIRQWIRFVEPRLLGDE